MKLPEINSLLPDSAVSKLEAHFFKILKESGVNSRGEPKYDIYDDRDVYALIGTKAYSLVMTAYDKAFKRYDADKDKSL